MNRSNRFFRDSEYFMYRRLILANARYGARVLSRDKYLLQSYVILYTRIIYRTR